MIEIKITELIALFLLGMQFCSLIALITTKKSWWNFGAVGLMIPVLILVNI